MSNVKKRQLSSLSLIFAMFLCVSGGAFGLEPLMAESGAGMGLLLILIVPVIWALPIVLKTAELSSAIPEEGGYYVWVKRAMGPFAGFLCGWWTWLYSMVDAALYPVLFSEYTGSLLKLIYGRDVFEQVGESIGQSIGIPVGGQVLQWLIAVTIIVIFSWLNIRGARPVGLASIAFSLILLAPFATMVIAGLPGAISAGPTVFQPFTADGQTWFTAMAAGMYVAMWNYLGWDSLTTVSEEVDQPHKAFPKALFVTLVLTVLAYLLPAWIGLAYYGDALNWEEGLWPQIAAQVGGTWLGVAMAFAALFSAMGLFMTAMLAASRIPYVLGEDSLLPKSLSAVHPTYGTPKRAIIVSGILYAAVSAISFTDLLTINVILYSAALMLQFAAFLVLRKREPDMPRPYKVPGGWTVAWIISLLPAGVLGLAIYNEFLESMAEGQATISSVVTLAAILSGPIWYLVADMKRRKATSAPELQPEPPL